MMKIMPNRMDYGFQKYQQEFEEKALSVLRSGWYVLGNEVKTFEERFAEYTGASYCVGLASGLDALWIGCKMLGIGPGDEVIVQANTYIASVMGISMNGATPVFTEPDAYFQIDADKIEEKITAKTKAIMVVHLYGHVADMDKIVSLCKKYNLKLIEDCAQSHGATYKGQMTGTFGDVGCFSFYPSKGCGAFGDAGCVVTDNEELADKFRVFRNYGSRVRYQNEVVGANSRLDELQAGLLRVKLKHLDEFNDERNRLAKRYYEGIKNPLIQLPQIRPGADSSWHQYVVHVKEGKRDGLMNYLKEKDIGTIIHYPIPPHLSKAYEYLGHKKGDFPITEKYASEVLSLPMYNGMTEEEQDIVIKAINEFK